MLQISDFVLGPLILYFRWKHGHWHWLLVNVLGLSARPGLVGMFARSVLSTAIVGSCLVGCRRGAHLTTAAKTNIGMCQILVLFRVEGCPDTVFGASAIALEGGAGSVKSVGRFAYAS